MERAQVDLVVVLDHPFRTDETERIVDEVGVVLFEARHAHHDVDVVLARFGQQVFGGRTGDRLGGRRVQLVGAVALKVKLGEHDEVGALPGGLGDVGHRPLQIGTGITECGIELGQSHLEAIHAAHGAYSCLDGILS